MTSYAIAVLWIICGSIAWKIATTRGGNGALWVVLGQLFGPFAILAASLIRKSSSA